MWYATNGKSIIPSPGGWDTEDESYSHLCSAKSRHRLNQIEAIRANGIDHVVDLPQIVVCGDQSAGKSSVLEGVTGFPFPRQEGLCTRFPTEIILRHEEDSPTVINATVRPHTSRAREESERLKGYQRTIPDMSKLPSIIEEVSKLMNLRSHLEDDSGQAFASDVLRVEITGSIGLNLSVVDLPGLISVPNEWQTNEDVEAVRSMVNSFLENPLTIIVAVLQAGNDMSNQTIIQLARMHDPQGQRTVGIITKPDLINEGSEAHIAQVVNNNASIKLNLGFFILKNPKPSEISEGITMDQRLKRELKFFQSPPWARHGLDPNRIGAEKLRVFLQGLLEVHIEKQLPKVRDEIKKILVVKEGELRAMGNARPTVAHIRPFITNLSMRFYELLQAALSGNYHNNDAAFFSDNPDSRLRSLVQEKNTLFADTIREFGHRRKVTPSKAKNIQQEMPEEGRREDINDQLCVSTSEMMHWIKECYSRTRGKELPGIYNSALQAELFQEQSRQWASISTTHILDILNTVSQWVKRALARIAPDDGLRSEIAKIMQEWLETTETRAIDELNKLLGDERRGPMTYNHFFTEKVRTSKVDAHRTGLRSLVNSIVHEQDANNGWLLVKAQRGDELARAMEEQVTLNLNDQACKDALNELNVYYEVAMKTFVDNVARQVIERQIISPLTQAFCPNSVAQLCEEDLLAIGSETKQQTARRERLTTLVRGLTDSLKDLQRQISS